MRLKIDCEIYKEEKSFAGSIGLSEEQARRVIDDTAKLMLTFVDYYSMFGRLMNIFRGQELLLAIITLISTLPIKDKRKVILVQ